MHRYSRERALKNFNFFFPPRQFNFISVWRYNTGLTLSPRGSLCIRLRHVGKAGTMKWNGWVLFAVCAVSVDTQVDAVFSIFSDRPEAHPTPQEMRPSFLRKFDVNLVAIEQWVLNFEYVRAVARRFFFGFRESFVRKKEKTISGKIVNSGRIPAKFGQHLAKFCQI